MANAWSGSKYFQINPVRRQQDTGSDVQRGLQIGQEIGKLIGGVAGAVKSAQADAAANQLMTGQNIANQPGAGVTQDLGKLDGGGSDSGGPQPGPPQDLGTVPVDTTTFTNPSTGDTGPVQGLGGSDDQLAQAMAASRLQGSTSAPTVGGIDQGAAAQKAASSLSGGSGSDFTLNPSNYSSGGTGAGTVGGLTFTGGVAGMKLQQEFQKTQMGNQLQQLQLQKAQRDATAAQQEDAGTGRFAVDAQIKQAKLAQAQANLQKTLNPPKTGKEAVQPATNIDSEPVTDQNQLIATFDTNYGKGSFNRVAGTLMEPEQIPDPKNPGQTIPNPNAPQLSDDGQTVTVGPKSKRISMPIGEAQSYAKQINTQRNKSGMPAIRVPGEDQTVGSSAANPYVAKNNLDVYSRAPADDNGNGGWVRLPNGKITHLVRQNGKIVGQQN